MHKVKLNAYMTTTLVNMAGVPHGAYARVVSSSRNHSHYFPMDSIWCRGYDHFFALSDLYGYSFDLTGIKSWSKNSDGPMFEVLKPGTEISIVIGDHG